jgi:hypothetical protein
VCEPHCSSRHSTTAHGASVAPRRIEPINRSAWPFCHGERGDVG